MNPSDDEIKPTVEEIKFYQRQNIHRFRNALIDEFQNKCAYCGSKLGLTSQPEIDQFYPLFGYPDKAFELENLLLACSVCNRTKGNSFPLDKSGSPLLLNPRADNYADHIRIENDGTATPLTEKGQVTIDTLNLNRPALVEERKLQQLERDFLESYTHISNEYYSNFSQNIKTIREVNTFSEATKDNIKDHLRNMLFANVITSLETYLSDAFINTVKSNKTYLLKFVETFHNFRNEKFELSELFQYYDNIDEKATKAMLDVIYHDLPKVKGMYYDTLNVSLPDLAVIYKAVFMRHDFVHRNGKTKTGKVHKIESKDIEELCNEVEKFVNDINRQLNELNK
jgi:5-methylcytosine-specific restriction endonuclease McrA